MASRLDREAEITKIVLYHGWDYVHSHLPPFYQSNLKSDDPVLPLPEVLCQLLIDLGPTFVKLGQVLSTRPDLLDCDYIDALESLQSHVPAVPWENVQPLIEDQLQRPITQVFAKVEETAIAAGSLGQVHRGQLLNGEVVALKVQRPGIRQVIKSDLEILQSFIKYFSKGKLGDAYDLQALLDEFRNSILGELDFQREARNTEELNQNLAKSNVWPSGKLKVPKIYSVLTTDKLLVMEWIEGCELVNLKIPLKRKTQIARWIAQMIMQQVFLDGFFHADPHPGNFLYVDHAQDYHIVLLDCGMVSRLDPRTQSILIDLFVGTIDDDPRQIARAVNELGFAKEPVPLQIVESEFDRLLRRFYARPLEEIRFAELLNDVLKIPRNNHIQLPGSVGLLVKALTNVEGVARTLDPQFPFIDVARPVIEQALRKNFISQHALQRAVSSTLYSLRSLPELPQRLERLIDRIERSELDTNLHWNEQDEFQSMFSQSLQRLSLALLAVGAIIAGALLVAAESNSASSLVFGQEVFWGNALLATGLGLAIWLVVDIFIHP